MHDQSQLKNPDSALNNTFWYQGHVFHHRPAPLGDQTQSWVYSLSLMITDDDLFFFFTPSSPKYILGPVRMNHQ